MLSNSLNRNLRLWQVNDPRFTFADGEFVWQTGFEDFGRKTFEINVSDGELSDDAISKNAEN